MTKVDTPPNLRDQIIEAIALHQGWEESAEILFDKAIMPVLQRAIDAGALIVGRNTGPRIPIHQAVMVWLEQVTGHVMMIRTEEATISRRQLLKILYQFGDNAEKALADAIRNNAAEH